MFSQVYDLLFEAGALDVWLENILMKKGRPGFLLGVLAESPQVPAIVDLILNETTTSGVRLRETERVKLARREADVETRFGRIRVKVFRTKRGERCAPEYDDCLRVAKAQGVPVADVIEEARHAFRKTAAGSQ